MITNERGEKGRGRERKRHRDRKVADEDALNERTKGRSEHRGNVGGWLSVRNVDKVLFAME